MSLIPLLPLASGGDRAAIRNLIERYGSLVWSLAQRANLPEDQMEEAVHEIFQDLWRSATRFDPTIASEATFVAMIARRRLVARRRGATTRRTTSETFGDLVGTIPRPELGEQAAKAARVLTELKAEERHALVLTACQALSHEEVAHMTGTPVDMVRTNTRRGLLRVRDALISAEPPIKSADSETPETKQSPEGSG